MTKIAFITSPLSSGHTGRGIGFYTQHLLTSLRHQATRHNFEIIETSQISETANYGLVHYPYFDCFFPTLPLQSRHKFVVTVHDVIPLEFPQRYPPGLKGKIIFYRQKTALAKAAAVITCSLASVKGLRKYLNIPHQKIKLVYEAAASQYKPTANGRFLASLKAKYHLPDRFVLYVGDVNWNKNLPGLVQACVSQQIPLVLVGRQLARLESLPVSHAELTHVRELQTLVLNNQLIIRPGFVPDADLAGIYHLAVCYCQPSFAEGFGLPVLEAMACGTPVVCSQTHSLPEIAGSAAIYFDPYNVSSIADSIRQVWTDPKLHSRLKSAGLVQSRKFSWAKTAAETLAVYTEVVNT